MQSPSVSTSWPAVVSVVAVTILGNAAITFFIAKAVFDRAVINALQRSKPALREVVDEIYAKEFESFDAMDARIIENANRNTWVDGQIHTLNDQVVAQSRMLTEAIDKVGDAIERSAERSERTMEKNDQAIENLANELGKTSQAVAELKGFLKGANWNVPRRPTDD